MKPNWTKPTTTPGQSEPGSNENEEVLLIPQSSRAGASPLDGLVPHEEHLVLLFCSGAIDIFSSTPSRSPSSKQSTLYYYRTASTRTAHCPIGRLYPLQRCKTKNPHPKKGVLNRTLNCICWWGYSSEDLRYATRPYERGTEWNSNSLVKVW